MNSTIALKLTVTALIVLKVLWASSSSVLCQINPQSQGINEETVKQSGIDDNLSSTDREASSIEWLEAIASLIQHLAWPATCALLLLMFRSQIAQLTNVVSSRMQSGKFKVLGAEFEIVNSATNTAEFKELVQKNSGEKPDIVGNPDMFQLLFKATSQNMSKSTKVMNTPNGCIVQVTTKEISSNGTISVAEAVTYVPDLNINVSTRKDEEDEVRTMEFLRMG